MPDPKLQSIEVTFPVPVELPDKWEQRLDQLVGEVCSLYEQQHPDRVMWPCGSGQKITYMPMTREDEMTRGLEFDDTTYAIDVHERERYGDERKLPRASARETLAVRWARVGYMLAQLYEAEEARLWMGLVNKFLGGKRPRECDPEEIEPVLEQLLKGAHI